jgi:galactose mutarotase-like enzyme
VTIGRERIAGFEALTLASPEGELEAAFVPEAGMVGCSLTHRGEQLLGQRHGLEGYAQGHSTMGIPLLYPWANRLSEEQLEPEGRSIDLRNNPACLKRDQNGLPIHGLLTAAPGWSVIRHEPLGRGGVLEARFDWSEQPGLAELYPFPHRLTLEARLEGERLTVATTIEAGGGVAVPVAFGFHPYLTLPGVDREAWQVELPVSEELVLDRRGLPTGERKAVEIASGPLGERGFDNLYLAPTGGEPFAITGGLRRIELSMDAAYPFAQLYSPPGAALLAIEPMTAPTNALVTGEYSPVAAGRQLRAGFSISVRAY